MARADRIVLVLLALSTITAPFLTLYMVKVFSSNPALASSWPSSLSLSDSLWSPSSTDASSARSTPCPTIPHSTAHTLPPASPISVSHHPTAAPNFSSTDVLPAWNLCVQPNIPTVLDMPFDDIKFRLLVYETHYSYSEGIFVLHAIIMPFDMAMYSDPPNKNERVWWREERLKSQIEQIRDRVRCSVGQYAPSPLDKVMRHNDNSFEFRCPYRGYPRLPSANTPLTLALHDSKQPTAKPSTHALCPVYRPVVELAWCGKGLQGPRVGPQALEFILYHLALGVGAFMVFDEDGLVRDVLQPLIDAGVVEYHLMPRLYDKAPGNFIQNLQYEVCRARYWYSAQWILYSDTDEWIILGQSAIAPINPDNTASNVRLTSDSNVSQLIAAEEADTEPSDKWIVGIQLLHCAAVQIDDAHATSIYQADRFPWCNFRLNDPKYMLRPQVHACHITGHDPGCGDHAWHTADRMDQAAMVHFHSSLAPRSKYDATNPQHKSLRMVGLIEKVKQQAEKYNVSIYT